MSKKPTERDWEAPECIDWDESERQSAADCNPNCVPFCVPSCTPSCTPSCAPVLTVCYPSQGGYGGGCRPYYGGGYGHGGYHGGHRQMCVPACVPSCVPSCAPSCVPYVPVVCYPSQGCRPTYGGGGCRPYMGGGGHYGGHRPPG